MTTTTSAIGGNLQGRVAYVTGGTRGIGAAISRTLAAQGAAVAAGYAGNQQRAEEFLQELQGAGGGDTEKYSIHQGNIGEADDCRRTAEEVLDKYGRIDILVNNAGITRDHVVAKMTDDDWETVIGVDLSGAFYMTQAVLPGMLERGTGRIINISSLVGEMGNIGQANYSAAKSGLFGLTKTLARECCFQLARSGKLEDNNIGVTVNVVTPGFVSTEMVQAVPEKVLNKIREQIPVRRLADPSEIGRAVHFLAADESGFITGQVLAINGGQDM